jgi:hypothetical protein
VYAFLCSVIIALFFLNRITVNLAINVLLCLANVETLEMKLEFLLYKLCASIFRGSNEVSVRVSK